MIRKKSEYCYLSATSNSYKLELQLARLQATVERTSALLRQTYSAYSLQSKEVENLIN